MEKKTNRHRWEIDQIMTEINEFYSHFNALLSNRTDNMTKLANDLKMKHSKATVKKKKNNIFFNYLKIIKISFLQICHLRIKLSDF